MTLLVTQYDDGHISTSSGVVPIVNSEGEITFQDSLEVPSDFYENHDKYQISIVTDEDGAPSGFKLEAV